MQLTWSDPVPPYSVEHMKDGEVRARAGTQWLEASNGDGHRFTMGMVYREEYRDGNGESLVKWRAYSNMGSETFAHDFDTEEEAKAMLLCHVRLG